MADHPKLPVLTRRAALRQKLQLAGGATLDQAGLGTLL